MSSFHPAVKVATPARIALGGPSGSGKTYTALALAHAFGGSIAVIDTNRRSSLLYAGLNKWEFDAVHPTTFSPQSLIDLVLEAGDAGYDNLIVDSHSLYWFGPEGMLEQVDARARGANQNQGWKEMRPLERGMMDALLAFPGNVIVTLRVKTEAVVDRARVGEVEQTIVRRVGLKPEQRDGLEYEFDLYGDLDAEHGLMVTKSRIPALASTHHPKPGKALADKITKFLSDGKVIPSATELRDKSFAALTKDEVNELGKIAMNNGLLQAPVRGADDAINTLENVLIGRRFALPTADELAATQLAEDQLGATQVDGPAPGEAPNPDPQQPPAGDAWQQPDVPTPDYITGKPEPEGPREAAARVGRELHTTTHQENTHG